MRGQPERGAGRPTTAVGRCLQALALVAWLASAAWAQRVQIPTPSPPGAFGPPPPFDPYSGGGALGAPAPTSGFAQPAPPTFGAPAQPYAQPYSGQPLAPPSYGAPAYGAQSYGTQPYAPQPYAGEPAPVFGGEAPFAWEPGSYHWQAPGGGDVTFTKFLQKLDAEYTHLFGGDAVDELQLNRVEVTSTFAWPLGGNLNNPLLLTPGFAVNFFDWNLPFVDDFETYEAFLDAAWFPQLNEAFGAELGVRTGVWTDFNEVNSDSIRILGRALAVVRVSPTMEVLAGVVYLDRRRIKLLPAGGVRWRPSDNFHLDAVFPNPVARYRLRSAGSTQFWLFVAGEYGGGSWTTDFAPTGFDYNDVRVSLGVEFETASRISGSFEVGYVFERELYFPGPAAFNLDETVMLRAGINL